TNAVGLSADGSSVVGYCQGDHQHAFLWTVATGMMIDLGTLPGDNNASAIAVIGDGSVVYGECNFNGNNIRPFRWTAATGMIDIGSTLGDPTAYISAVSTDGSTIVGSLDVQSTTHAFRWSAGTGLADLGVPPGWSSSFASSVSANGSVVAGSGTN